MTAVEMTATERRERIRTDEVEQFRRMVEIRRFEDRINELFARGIVHGTTHTCQGQEALDVGLASVLRSDDVVTCTYRGHGIALALGMTPRRVLGEIMGRVTGPVGGLGGSMHLSEPDVGLLPTFAIVGAGIPVAAGAALAFQTRNEDRVAVAVFGDGATNIGAFHEGLNLAAIWKLPVVFVCDNNLYGEYSRIQRTTPMEDLDRRAESYGIPGVSVDGMDANAVRGVMHQAADRARRGEGPTLVEAKTYRFAGHSRADQAPYRPAGELEAWRKRDPLAVCRARLLEAGVGDEVLDGVVREVAAEIEEVVEATMATPEPSPAAMFRHVWGVPPHGWAPREEGDRA